MSTDNRSETLELLKDLWAVYYERVTLLNGPAVYSMWSHEQLHHFAVTGREQNNFVDVPIFSWVSMKAMGDRMHVPTACYIPVQNDVYYCNWPVTSGLMYPVAACQSGGSVSIPVTEFKICVTKGGNK